jgi:hypothetical protein
VTSQKWDDLFGYRIQCGKIGPIDKNHLMRRDGVNVVLRKISTLLVCRGCGARSGDEFGTSNKPRD